MNDLPIDSNNQRTGRMATSMVTVALEKLGVLVRNEAQETDFGSDLELEMHDAGAVSGRIVKCQVKGTDTSPFAARNTKGVSIKARTQNYWAALSTNVVCILCDVTTGGMYWLVPSTKLVTTAHTSLTFSQAQRLDTDPADFLAAVSRLAETPTSSRVLFSVPAGLSVFNHLAPLSQRQYDRGFEVEPEIDGALRMFYEHLERLSIFVGSNLALEPWVTWERRNSIVRHMQQADDTVLFDGNVASEVVRYAAPVYEESLSRVADCIEAESLWNANPPLASLLATGALQGAEIAAAFDRYRASGQFYLEDHGHWSLFMQPDQRDRDFDLMLETMGVSSYPLSRWL